jgi:hypothetical protein
MAHRQTEIKDLVERELRSLGFSELEFGVKKRSTHQYVNVRVEGIVRQFTFSLTPSVLGYGQLRSIIRRRLRDWGWQGQQH